jgi:DNA adenine methylase
MPSRINQPWQHVDPFLKWAGGKRWLISRRLKIFSGPIRRYIEPFLGGGAVFFHVQPLRSILGDSNKELVDVYRAIKRDWKEVVRELKIHDEKHSKVHYYRVRDAAGGKLSERAARFIYLNRTCWNGLYRVNLDGQFNVPKGTKSKVLLPDDNFEYVAFLLKGAELVSGDFQVAIDRAGEGDLLFVDPPYTVKHNNNNFVKYNEKLFSWKDQLRLRLALARAKNRGARIVSTNAFHESVRKLYEDFGTTIELSRHSVLAAESKFRGHYSELLITAEEKISKFKLFNN